MKRTRARLRLLLFVARKSLFASRVTVVLLGLAIAAGAGFQIPNSANLDGFGIALLDDGLTRGPGDVRVEPRESLRFQEADQVAKQVGKLVGAQSTMAVFGLAGAVGVRGRFFGAPVFGIDPGEQPFHLVEGRLLNKGEQAVLIGTALAQRMNVKVGDQVDTRVIFGPPDVLLGLDNTGRYTLPVRGIVSGSGGGYRSVFFDRTFIAEEAGAPRSANAIVVRLHDHFAAEEAAAKIAAAMPEAHATSWLAEDAYLRNYLSANRTINTVSYAMVIAAVSIPMWALLYIHVLKRRREIAILAALGFGRLEIFLIYVLQSLVVAVLGCALGSLVGYGLIRYFDANPLFQWESLVVRPLVTAGTFLVPAAIIVGTAVIAGMYPALRAARTDPARVLRSIE